MAINVEIAKLTKEGILLEVVFLNWNANPIMVKKHDGRLYMCIDYSDVNKACHKDCYPYQKSIKNPNLCKDAD